MVNCQQLVLDALGVGTKEYHYGRSNRKIWSVDLASVLQRSGEKMAKVCTITFERDVGLSAVFTQLLLAPVPARSDVMPPFCNALDAATRGSPPAYAAGRLPVLGVGSRHIPRCKRIAAGPERHIRRRADGVGSRADDAPHSPPGAAPSHLSGGWDAGASCRAGWTARRAPACCERCW